jgi:hypothetical protein
MTMASQEDAESAVGATWPESDGRVAAKYASAVTIAVVASKFLRNDISKPPIGPGLDCPECRPCINTRGRRIIPLAAAHVWASPSCGSAMRLELHQLCRGDRRPIGVAELRGVLELLRELRAGACPCNSLALIIGNRSASGCATP